MIRQVPTKYRASTEQVPGKYRLSTDQVPTKYRENIKEIEKLLIVIDGEMEFNEILKSLEMNHKPHFRKNYLHPALEEGFVEMTIPEKPKSSKQKYRLTDEGKKLKHQLLQEE